MTDPLVPSPVPAGPAARSARTHPPRFVVVGAYVADCLVSTPRLPGWGEHIQADAIRTTPGGKALNQAVTLARGGAHVTAVGIVGGDAVGRDLVATLTAEGIDTAHLTVQPNAPTPVCVVFTRPDGQNATTWGIADNMIASTEIVYRAKAEIAHADAVLITFEAAAEAIRQAVTIARDAGTRVIVNPAPSPADLTAYRALPWQQVDMIIPNEAEARALLPEHHPARAGQADGLAEALGSTLGVPTVCVTLAADGCTLWDASAGTSTGDRRASSANAQTYSAHPTDVIDTTGGSDAFTAVLALHLLSGTDQPTAVRHAHAAAALTISRPGTYDALPTAAELRDQRDQRDHGGGGHPARPGR
ncbi:MULTISPECIES: PfkB family carbohydrate kinase [unclassified Frankia]|uniref:PfkB family carbohydrate kinase n=1 Tax=unclassified Frankia TaxID=2632575 RepID=UPI002AD1E9EB|nr:MULTISPECIES: PfkB family carbohydrate kinase [unclassified Frankia]